MYKTGAGTWVYTTSAVNQALGRGVGTLNVVAGTMEIDRTMGHASLGLAGGTILVGTASPFSESGGVNDNQLSITAAGGKIGLSPLVTSGSVTRTTAINNWDQLTPT